MAFTAKILPYGIYEVTWTTAPTNLAMDLDGVANMFKIITGPSDLAIRLNSTDNDLIEYAAGMDNAHPFSEIYITSAQDAGSCRIHVGWEGP